MGSKANDVLFDGMFKSSEDREGDNERGYSEGDAHDGDHCDEGDETPVPAGTKISERYENRYGHDDWEYGPSAPVAAGAIFSIPTQGDSSE